jgi:hypothetical protein
MFNGGDGLHIHTAAVTMMNTQLRTVDKGWSSKLEDEQRAINSSQ